MNRYGFAGILAAAIVSIGRGSTTLARDLTFAERVLAEEAIQRLYYSHQIGAAKTFEAAVPRSLLEQSVRRYLAACDAVEREWHTPITPEMLE